MSRSRITAVIAGSVAFSALSLLPLAGPAAAEPTFTPQTDDIVGVGSDTTQYAMDNLIDGATVDGGQVAGYNTSRTSARLVSFDAIGTGLSSTIVPKQGDAAITRPNGSGAGKALLYGSGNLPSINYARSSSALSDAEVSANLWAVPFAVDGLKMAVDATATNAPASVSPADLVKIYDGTYTNWSQLGGQDGVIDPLIPQSGSGTRSFFLAQLKAANNGADVVMGSAVKETQEHSDTDIKTDPNAIAPFSTGRAKTMTTIALLGGKDVGGFEAQRALYNVVRQSDLTTSWFSSIFGEDGFICSTAARPLIEKAGFQQLATSAGNGECGNATQAATTNFTTNNRAANQATATGLATNVTQRTVRLTATVTAPSDQPVGEVQFFDGATQVGAPTPLQGGVALTNLSNVMPGTHSYKAVYSSSDPGAFQDSASAASPVTVAKSTSATTVTMASRFRTTKRVPAAVKVVAAGKAAAGTVTVKDGTRKIASGTLKLGKVTITLPRLTRGKHRLVFSYLGNATTKGSSLTKSVTVTR